jgi:bifunctional non-homologous end joining protein LigD
MHARLDRGAVRLLTRTGLDRTHKYPAIAAAVASLPARQAYLDGELCGICPDGTTSFSLIQNASDTRSGEALVFFLFDLLHLDGEAIAPMPVTERKERLRPRLSGTGSPLQYSDHQIGRGRAFYDHACALKVEGIVSKRVDAPYAPGNRGLWLKVKCLNREEFVVVGWTDPEGARPWLRAESVSLGNVALGGRSGPGFRQECAVDGTGERDLVVANWRREPDSNHRSRRERDGRRERPRGRPSSSRETTCA